MACSNSNSNSDSNRNSSNSNNNSNSNSNNSNSIKSSSNSTSNKVIAALATNSTNCLQIEPNGHTVSPISGLSLKSTDNVKLFKDIAGNQIAKQVLFGKT